MTTFNRRNFTWPEEKGRSQDRFLTSRWMLTDTVRQSYDMARRDPAPIVNGVGTFDGILASGSDGLWYVLDGVGGGVVQGRVYQASTPERQDLTTQDFSVSIWAKYGSSFGGNFPGIFSKQAGTSTAKGWYIGVRTDASNGKPYFEVGDQTNLATVTWGTALTDNRPHLIVGFVNRTGGVIGISVDGGTPVTTSIGSVGSLTNAERLRVGNRATNTGVYTNKFIGQVRDARLFFNRVLTQDDMVAIYKEKDAVPEIDWVLPIIPVIPYASVSVF